MSLLRKITPKLLSTVRLASTQTLIDGKMTIGLVNTSIHPENDEIAVVKLSAPPINALSKNMLRSLESTVKSLEQEEDVKGFILTSEKPGIFSAGLDIFSMYGKNREELTEFWTSVQDLWKALYGTPLATVASINGTSPAGGCLLATCCDHRVMVNHPKFNIGLNETKLGLVAPLFFVRAYQNCIGPRLTERHLNLGTLFDVETAQKIGLVDDVVKSAEDCFDKSFERAEEYCEIIDKARSNTKLLLRSETLEWFEGYREKDLELFLTCVQDPMVQNSLNMYVKMLQAKSKK